MRDVENFPALGSGPPAVAMPGLGLLLATTAVAVLAFGTVLNRARAAYAWFDALVAPEDDQSVSVDDALRTVWWVLTVLLVPVSSINWHLLKWLALTGRLILHELLQNIWFAVWLVSLPLRWVSEFMVAQQQIFWSTPRSDAAKRLRAEHLATPQNAFTNRPARPLLQKFFRCAGQIAAPCGARYLSWGEARRKRLQVRTKSTKTRSSPRRFRNWRSRSSILHGAPVRQLAMHWATPGEQWLLPLRHSSSGAWLKPCPWLGIELGQRLTLTALFATLFAAASSPPHLPMHPRPLQVVARRFTPRRAPDLVALHPRPHLSPPSSPPPPVAPLAATAIAPQSRQWCLCVAVVVRLRSARSSFYTTRDYTVACGL